MNQKDVLIQKAKAQKKGLEAELARLRADSSEGALKAQEAVSKRLSEVRAELKSLAQRAGDTLSRVSEDLGDKADRATEALAGKINHATG